MLGIFITPCDRVRRPLDFCAWGTPLGRRARWCESANEHPHSLTLRPHLDETLTLNSLATPGPPWLGAGMGLCWLLLRLGNCGLPRRWPAHIIPILVHRLLYPNVQRLCCQDRKGEMQSERVVATIYGGAGVAGLSVWV